MGGNNKVKQQEEVTLNKKEQKKVTKLEAQIPYHEKRGNKDDVIKTKELIDAIWAKATAALAAAAWA